MGMELSFGPKNSIKAIIESITWWNEPRQRARFPLLSRFAISLLAVQASSGSCERMFSIAGWHTAGRKNRLDKERLAAKVFLSANKKLFAPYLFKS